MAANDRKRPAVTDPRAAERRRSLLLMIGATVVVVVVAVGIGVWLIVSKDDGNSTTQSLTGQPRTSASAASGSTPSGSAPSVVTDTGAFRVNKVSGTPKATLTLLEDFQCPACKQFESIFGDAVKQIREKTDVAVDYKPIAILDRMSSTNYSTRAANASACVAQSTASNGDYSTWLAYHDALYAQQPEEQSSGLTDEQLVSIATDAGAPASISSCVDDGQYSGWVTTQTEKAIQNNLKGTPQVELNGKIVELSSPQALIAAVDAAVA